MNTRKLIYGVGIKDAEYKTIATRVLDDGKQINVWICPFYRAWRDMLARCYSASYQSRYPAYVGCSVSEEWLKLSAFTEWMINQDWEGKCLDKDILFPGNKVYSGETCVFVESRLNLFLVDRRADRGAYPLGVSRINGNGNFRASCSNPWSRKNESLGVFASPEAAHEAWRACKHRHALVFADMQDDPRIACALRSRFAMI